MREDHRERRDYRDCVERAGLGVGGTLHISTSNHALLHSSSEFCNVCNDPKILEEFYAKRLASSRRLCFNKFAMSADDYISRLKNLTSPARLTAAHGHRAQADTVAVCPHSKTTPRLIALV